MRSAVSLRVLGVSRENTGHAWRNSQISADSLTSTFERIRPSTRFTIRSATSRMRLSWVTMMIVQFSVFTSSWKSVTTSRPDFSSSAAVGSSARTSFGLWARPRAMATRCFCPPESDPGL